MRGQTSERPRAERTDAWRRTFRDLVVGLDARGPGGRPLVGLDLAATTPPLRPVQDAVDDVLPWHGSIHRGAGLKSQRCSAAYEAARAEVLRFTGAPADYTCIFVKHATEGLNLLASRLVGPSDRVLVPVSEHHANLLPWRERADVRLLPAHADGVLDEAALATALRAGARVLTLSAASNVTGAVTPVAPVARLAHAHGALLVVDAAQLVAHRRMGLGEDPEDARPDAVVFSGHKAFAPYGAGAVVVRRELLRAGRPLLLGGGMAREVTADGYVPVAPPGGDEAGTPNLVGAVALGVALATLDHLGMDGLADAEDELVRTGLAALAGVPGLTLYGPQRPEGRLGVFSFALDGWSPDGLAAVLDDRYGIAVRAGRFCAHPLVDHLRAAHPGDLPRDAVRASVAACTTPQELELLGEALTVLAELGPAARRAATEAAVSRPAASFDLRARVRGLPTPHGGPGAER